MMARLSILAVLALVLAGCGSSRDPAIDASPQAATPDASSERTAAVPRPPARIPMPPADIDPGQILKANGDQVMSLLGKPEMKRREKQAELWQYRSSSCVLNLFVYPTGANHAPEVTHVEARARAGGIMPTRICLASLIAKRNGRG
ncbi:MAG: hypothetical protein U1E97_10740 [Alphaproteobacteria bacterium]